jgi:RNA polymerase sigma factor (sigma-70 family)
MSPLNVRRYRAERLLRREFDRSRAAVLATVRARLRASGVSLDAGDLEACYAEAWQGLYATLLDGQEVANPGGWLALVTFRRAIDEHRARLRQHCAESPDELEGAIAGGRDLPGELDDRIRLRQLFEALRGRLSERELQAATLCYLQGLTRSEAAERMGVSEARVRKLMEGHGNGRPGVAGKVGALVATIRDGGWCEEQGSLMRGLAYGILDPEGDRYRLARIHRDECPACRAYVLSLRGLAAVLPPVPALLRWVLAATGTGGAGAGAAGGAGAHAGAGVGGGVGGQPPPVAGGPPPLAGATGAGAAGAGGGWALAGGGAAAKLAVGCLLAAGIGASCAALTLGPLAPAHSAGGGHHARRLAARSRSRGRERLVSPALGTRILARSPAPAPSRPSTVGSLTPVKRATHEFGLEQPPARFQSAATGTARSARSSGPASRSAASTGASASVSADRSSAAGSGQSDGGPSEAQREFGIG